MAKKIMLLGVGSVVVFFLLVLADLVPFWMPMMGEMVALAVVTVALLLFLAFVIAEAAADERELVIAMRTGRFAYVAGILTLLLALVVQVLAHVVDPWIPITLAVMVGSKVLSRLYLE